MNQFAINQNLKTHLFPLFDQERFLMNVKTMKKTIQNLQSCSQIKIRVPSNHLLWNKEFVENYLNSKSKFKRGKNIIGERG